MSRRAATVAALWVVVWLATPGHALHCNGNITAISAGGETLYIDDRSSTAGEINHWTYLESNGIEGLQSGDRGIITEQYCALDHCVSMDEPCDHVEFDTLIL